MVKIQCTCSKTCFNTFPSIQYLHYKIRGIIGSCVMDFRGSIVTCWRTSRMFHQSSCSSHHISLSVCLIGHFLQLLLTKNTFQINLQNSGHIGMVEEVRVPSEPDGKDVVKEEDPEGPVKVKARSRCGTITRSSRASTMATWRDCRTTWRWMVLSCMISKTIGKCGKSM